MRRINETLAIPERNSRGFRKRFFVSHTTRTRPYARSHEGKEKFEKETRKKERMKNHNTHTTHAGIKHDAFVSFAYT